MGINKKDEPRITLKDFISQLPKSKECLGKKLRFHTSDKHDLYFLSVYESDDHENIEIDIGEPRE